MLPHPQSSSLGLESQTPKAAHIENTLYPPYGTPISSMCLPESAESCLSQSSAFPPLWDFEVDNSLETLLAGENFDLNAVNFALLSATSDHMPTEELQQSEILGSVSQVTRKETEKPGPPVPGLTQRKWFTFEQPISQQAPLDTMPEEGIIDEHCREQLSADLQTRVQHGILPSTLFLVCSLPQSRAFCVLIF